MSGFKQTVFGLAAAAALACAPVAPAAAGEHGFGHLHSWGLGRGLVGAVVGLATLPIVIASAVLSAAIPDEPYQSPGYEGGAPGYAPPSAYYGPPQQSYYAPPPAYYAPPQQSYYAPPPAYYAPPQRTYYAPPPAYYPRAPVYSPAPRAYYAPRTYYAAPHPGYYGGGQSSYRSGGYEYPRR
jgi:hypothetical protein